MSSNGFIKVDKAYTVVLSEYTKFTNIFSLNFAAKLLKNLGINDYLINLGND